jgi:23S rRNA pseudouridine1911/1915/1917 synthase
LEGRFLTLAVTPEQEGRTVDVLLRRALFLSGTLIKRAKSLPEGITLDGLSAPANLRVKAGQVLSVFIGDTDAGGVPPVRGPLDIVYEDEDLILLNKQPGAAVHPGPGHHGDTLGNFLAFYYRQQGLTAGIHPVNRLDRGTSGLMAAAKHAYAQERLRSQLHTGDFQRTYLAVCRGVPAPFSGVLDAPIARAEGSALRREVREDGRSARTAYEVLKVHGGRALVRLVPETGRTHQIRVHMAYLGCPLVGDFLYGAEERELISRPALHSHTLSLIHPVTGERLSRSVPLPEDMAALLD